MSLVYSLYLGLTHSLLVATKSFDLMPREIFLSKDDSQCEKEVRLDWSLANTDTNLEKTSDWMKSKEIDRSVRSEYKICSSEEENLFDMASSCNDGSTERSSAYTF